jgi:hypothetical protein
MKQLAILLFCALALAAQTTTTYSLTVGTICNSIEGCYLPATDGSMLETGGYWTQFDYPGRVKALYCNGTAVWVTSVLATGNTLFVLGCQASPDGTSSDPPALINAEIEAHTNTFSFPCGVRGSRGTCHITRWVVDAGIVAITQPAH